MAASDSSLVTLQCLGLKVDIAIDDLGIVEFFVMKVPIYILVAKLEDTAMLGGWTGLQAMALDILDRANGVKLRLFRKR